MQNNQDIEEIKTELVGFKIRLKRIETFLLDTPDIENYIESETYNEDELFDEAVKVIQQYDAASASLLQRRLSLGYARASRLLDQLESEGYVGPAIGSKPRKVLKK